MHRLITRSEKATSAYEMVSVLRHLKHEVAPLQVYRIIRRLVAEERIMRIESVQAYCAFDPGKMPTPVLVCERCRRTHPAHGIEQCWWRQIGRLSAGFMRAWPEVQLDLDFSDRLVDVIQEGFDAVVRTGHPSDSRLMSRNVGRFKLKIVASPDYLARFGVPDTPNDLVHHQCLHQRSPSTGKLRSWPFARTKQWEKIVPPERMSATAVDPLIELADTGARS